MNPNEDLKQDQKVSFIIDGTKATGKVVGKANNGHPFIGSLYIIEPDIPIRNDVYDHTHFVMFENQLTLC